MFKRFTVFVILLIGIMVFAEEGFAYMNMDTIFIAYYKTVKENINVENMR